MFVPKFISLNWSVPASPFNFPPRTDVAEMVNCNGSWDHLTKKSRNPQIVEAVSISQSIELSSLGVRPWKAANGNTSELVTMSIFHPLWLLSFHGCPRSTQFSPFPP